MIECNILKKNNHRYPMILQNKPTVWILTILRIFVGWHFLYEGIVKLFNPDWSSASYLMESKWLAFWFFSLADQHQFNPQYYRFYQYMGIACYWFLFVYWTVYQGCKYFRSFVPDVLLYCQSPIYLFFGSFYQPFLYY